VKFFEDAGVGLSDGRDFSGRGYVRLNFGCPRATLQEALKRMERGVR
jgi:cystathionine beta-lyase